MKIIEKGYADDRMKRGDKLLIGNGCLGYRGTLEENRKDDCVALTTAGFYDRYKNNWRETVNMPNPLYTVVKINGVPLDGSIVKSHVESLNLSNGVFERNTTFKVNGTTIRVKSERFFDQQNCGLLVSRYVVCANEDITAQIVLGIDCDVWNISGKHFNVTKTQYKPLVVFATTNEGKNLSQSLIVKTNVSGEPFEKDGIVGEVLDVKLKKDEDFVVDKFCVSTWDGLPEYKYDEFDFDALKAKNEDWWKKKLATCKVKITGEEGLQLAIDDCVYQLVIYAPRVDGTSISARGLSGQTYKGAVFWDTEMFMLPFYLATDVEVAKRLVGYRIATLQGAIDKAKYYGYKGAFYAWESHEKGQDACSDFNVTDVFTNRPVRTYFKDKQIHISADVAVALFRTYRKTKDISILLDGGLDVLFECSLFYWSYAYYNEDKNRYELLDVIGPDEYHERVNNNAYTNYMAHECICNFFDALKAVKKANNEYARDFVKKRATDIAKLEKLRKKLYLPMPDENGIIEQFDGYFKHEDVYVPTVRARLVKPNEYWGGSTGVATATRVIKQADVVSLLCTLPERFSDDVARKNYDFYLPYTEHGSSLSASMYALCACRIGKHDDAYEWFKNSAMVDLVGGGKKWAGKVYIGGSHPASCGGAWMIVANGFCADRSGKNLPKQIKEISYTEKHGERIIRKKVIHGD